MSAASALMRVRAALASAGQALREIAADLARRAHIATVPAAAAWVAILFAGCALGGWDARPQAVLVAAALCATVSTRLLTPGGAGRLFTPRFPVVAALLFLAAVGWSLAQGAPGLAPSHPLWAAAGVAEDGPAALYPHAARAEAVKLLGLGAAFLIGVAAGRDRTSFDRVMRAVILAGAAYAGYALVAYGAALLAPAPASGRLFGGLASANAAGLVFGVVVILAAAAILRLVQRGALQGLPLAATLDGVVRAGPVSCTAFFLAGGALMLTASRAASALAIAGIVALAAVEGAAALRDREARDARAAALAVAGAALALALVFGGPLALRWETLALTDDPRLAITAAHARAAGEALMFGHGYGAFGVVNNFAMTEANAEALAPIGAAHNVYLQWVEEAGLLGAAPFFAALGLIVAPVLAAGARAAHQRHWARAGAAATLVAAAHASVDFALNIYALACLAALGLGAFWAAAQRERAVARDGPP